MRPLSRQGDRRVALIVTPRYLPFLGGQERECALLAAELKRRGFEPVVITEQLGTSAPRREMTDVGLVVRIPSSPQRTLAVQLRVALRMTIEIVRYRRSAALAIVRTVTLPALVVGLLKATRILTFPTLVTSEEEHDVQALAERPLFSISRRLVAEHDVLNALGEANLNHLRRNGFPPSKTTLIPNGIDTSAWEESQAPSRIRHFLFLGRIERSKGILELAQAFSEVHKRHPDARLTVAGEGPARDEFQGRVGAMQVADAVDLVGRVPYSELGDLFASVDCLVLPSWSEGMPLSLLEAAAHRRPMIVSDVGDVRATFGDAIRIVPPRDAEALAAAMESALQDPSPSAVYDQVVQRVSITTVVDRMLERLGVSG